MNTVREYLKSERFEALLEASMYWIAGFALAGYPLFALVYGLCN